MERWVRVENTNIEISDYGNIRNYKTKELKKAHVLNSGYLASKSLQNSPVGRLIHRNVGYYFVPGYKKGLDINHKNTKRQDNHYTNLEWMTRKENIHEMMSRGALDTKSAQRSLMKPVLVITNDNRFLKFESTNACARFFGFKSLSHVSKVLSGKKTTTRFKAILFVDDDIVQK